MSEQPSFFERFNAWMKASVGLKIFTIAFLVLILLIPIEMVEDLIWERKNYSEQVMMEISSTWGQHQTVTGPVLTIPFYRYAVVKNEDGSEKTVRTKYRAHFLPSELTLEGDVLPKTKKRGIYEAVLYKADMTLDGSFERPDFETLGINEEHVLWEQAKVSLGLTDLRSIQNEVAITWDAKVSSFQPGVPDTDVISSGISTPITISPEKARYTFHVDLEFNGSHGLHFTPLGKVTNVSLGSSWPDPKFNGAFLPEGSDITSEGFTAEWQVLHLNRNYPQEFEGNMNQIPSSSFGVELMRPVDHYMKSTRSVKYGILFISLTFLVYFFSQIRNKVRIHPVQYLIVGLAICLFFTILIALSEHIGFGKAYLAGSVAIIGMITAYSHTIFKSAKMTIVIGGILAVLYGFIYAIIQLQDYALLMGSAGLLIILALVMYISRNIDWYQVGDDKS